MATFSELIQKVVTRLSMVPGTSVQIYAEDRIGDMIQHKFDVLFDEFWWPKFMFTNVYALDGTLGVVTADLSSVLKSFSDIQYVWVEGHDKPLPQVPSVMNPERITGSTAKFIEPYYQSSKVFRVRPLTSDHNIVVKGRTKPDDFSVASSTEVPFDNQALILGATYDYLEDDGTNPGATEKFRILFENRVEQLKNKLQQQPIPLNPRDSGGIPNQWEEL